MSHLRWRFIAIVCCFSFLACGAEGADIFGLKKGMSIEQIRALGFGTLKIQDKEKGYYMVFDAKKPRGVDVILFVVTPSYGLLKASFHWAVDTNGYGHEVRRKYTELRDVLKAKYGGGDEIDDVMASSTWRAPKYFMMSILKKERFLHWQQENPPDYSSLLNVYVKVEATKLDWANVGVHYEFRDWDTYLKAQQQQEASQF